MTVKTKIKMVRVPKYTHPQMHDYLQHLFRVIKSGKNPTLEIEDGDKFSFEYQVVKK